MSVEACLPAHLQGPTTTITRVGAGLSGAGVYRVQAGDQALVLKIAGEGEPDAAWHRKLAVQQAAAAAGVAPAIVHVDPARRAVLSAFVADRSFPALYGDPRTREAALALLGQTVRRVHELPIPADAVASDPRGLLAQIASGLAGFPVPAFVGEVIRGVIDEDAPTSERGLVLSHNDVNPTNLVYDGERLLLLDWETAALNDPYYDLAAIAVFLQMDEATCQRVLAAYDGAPAAGRLPPRFVYCRRLVAALCGSAFLNLSRNSGHPGAAGGETLEATPSLGEFYQRLRAGAVSIASGDGQWAFGLALIKASTAL